MTVAIDLTVITGFGDEERHVDVGSRRYVARKLTNRLSQLD